MKNLGLKPSETAEMDTEEVEAYLTIMEYVSEQERKVLKWKKL